MVNDETPISNLPESTFWMSVSNGAVTHFVLSPSFAATASNRSMSHPMTVFPSVSRYSLGAYVESTPTVIVPSLLMSAGTCAASAESTEDCGVTVWLPPDDPPPQAASNVRAAATTTARADWRDERVTGDLRARVVSPSCQGAANLWGTLLCQDFVTSGDPRRHQ